MRFEPNIVATTSAAHLTIAPLISDQDIHVGGITLSGGAQLIVASVGNDRTNSNHNVLVVGAVDATTAPTFSVSTESKLDLQDNDLIIHDGNLASVQALAQEGRNAPDGPGNGSDGTWTGDGLTSSVAASADDAENADSEQNVLAVVRNGDMPLGQFTSRRPLASRSAITRSYSTWPCCSTGQGRCPCRRC